jgi:hypothetical protein
MTQSQCKHLSGTIFLAKYCLGTNQSYRKFKCFFVCVILPRVQIILSRRLVCKAILRSLCFLLITLHI